MKGLVGYGSSDEDEDESKPSETSTSAEEDAQTETKHEHQQINATRSEAVNGQQRPVVGPSRPSAVESYEETPPEELPPMPEADLLRHLTQPSHPVTSLPPAPESSADPVVTAKFRKFLELKSKGVHFNQDLAAKTSFKNPGLFASLLERASLSSQAQYSSTLPREVFNPDDMPAWAFKEELAKRQQQAHAQAEAIKRVQAAAGKRTIEFTSGINSTQSSPGISHNKRKQPG